jgi:hypothetical protein
MQLLMCCAKLSVRPARLYAYQHGHIEYIETTAYGVYGEVCNDTGVHVVL